VCRDSFLRREGEDRCDDITKKKKVNRHEMSTTTTSTTSVYSYVE
jgi:hypothetical protein